MDVNSELSRRRLNGTVEITELPPQVAGALPLRGTIHGRFRYHWKPPYQISRLPAWYDLALDCYVMADGTRRFSLIETSALSSDISLAQACVATAQGLALTASVGGHRILEDRGEIDANSLLTFDEARIFYYYIRHRRENLGATTKIDQTLAALLSDRPNATNQHASFADLGLINPSTGTTWDHTRFMWEGRQAALDAGIDNPSGEEVRRYGLISAVRMNPLRITDEESITTTRLTLFAINETTNQLTNEQLRFVAAHVRKSLMNHINDSNEDFEKWIEDPRAELAHAISKLRGSAFSRPQVRQALLELGWLAIQMIAKCVDAQFRAFRDALAEPLNETEGFYFAQSFLANPVFGGLPLLLLNERFDFLKDVILGIWNNPGDINSIAVAQTLMHFYAVLINAQRTVSRLRKQRAFSRNREGRIATEQSFVDAIGSLDKPDLQDQFRQAARLLIESRGIVCLFNEHDWQAELLEQGESTIRFRIWCSTTGLDESMEVPLKEFKRALERVEL